MGGQKSNNIWQSEMGPDDKKGEKEADVSFDSRLESAYRRSWEIEKKI